MAIKQKANTGKLPADTVKGSAIKEGGIYIADTAAELTAWTPTQEEPVLAVAVDTPANLYKYQNGGWLSTTFV